MPRRPCAILTLLVVTVALLVPRAPLAAQTISDPELFEKSLEVAHHAVTQYGTYDDPQEQKRVADIGYAVAQQSGFTAFPFTFHLADMPEPNAFALPGGHLFVTRGMLDLGLTDDMLAALLGHEIAHVVEEHYKEMRKKMTLMNVLSQVLVAGVLIAADNQRDRDRVINPLDPRYGTGDQTGDLVQGAAAASLVVSELLLRSYSRENEAESDLQGQRWAAAAGFDPLGAAQLMDLMSTRIPQEKRYGYWMTHPFFDERVTAAEANGKLIKRMAGESAQAFRVRTQATLLTYAGKTPPAGAPEGIVDFVKAEALVAWPIGAAAERLRLEKLHRTRDAELEKPPLSRDFGELIRLYKREAQTVSELDPATDFPRRLDKEADAFEAQRQDLYPKARQVLAEGIFETSFLTTFLSNFPDAAEVPEAALALGDAYSRLGNQTDAVQQYLRAWEAGPESEPGQRAARGLRVLAPRLEGLAALQQLALQERDAELAEIAGKRLSERATSFAEIDNGAEYLRRFPEGPWVSQVIDRVNALADDLLGEVLLYQAVGDTVKAIERINKILSHAPTSAAAERLRDRAVFAS